MAINPTQPDIQDSPTTNRKRASFANDAERQRAIKRRASRACKSCRARKVRCDVTASESQCTNCRLDNIKCVVLASRRGQTGRTGKNTTQPAKAQSHSPEARHEFNDLISPTAQVTSETLDSPGSPGSPGVPENVPVSVTFDEDPDKARRDEPRALGDASRTGTDHLVGETHDGSRLVPEIAAEAVNGIPSPGHVTLPPFIARLSGRISGEDLEFLTRKGAMTTPEPELVKDILQGYLLGVHPFMPMLDFTAFRDIVLGQREDTQISLLLFQAVMFAGLHPLEPQVLQRLGFHSVKQARESFFNRVRLLYEFDVERDSAAILQSLILMSTWYGKWDERKHTWHWTGLAYDVARNMGLHREPTARFASDKIRRFRRRLWWSLYMRDRLIALGTRRPMRIQDEDFDVAMLTLEDFDLDVEADTSRDQTLRLGAEENTSLAIMCIQLAELCKSIGHVVSSQYTVLNTHPDVPYTMMVVSKRNEDNTQELESCDRELSDWHRKLPENVRKADLNSTLDDPQSCSGVHWTILNVIYVTVVNVLHRAQALQPLPNSIEARNVQSSSKGKVKETARSLTKSLQTMLRHNQVRFLGPVGVTALVAASLSHMLDVSSNDEDIRDASAFRLSQNLQVLQALREAYASADAAISFLATVTRRAGLLVPAHVAPPAASSAAAAAAVQGHGDRPSISGKRSISNINGTAGLEWPNHVSSSSDARSGGWQQARLSQGFQHPSADPHAHSQLSSSGIPRPSSGVGTVNPSATTSAADTFATPGGSSNTQPMFGYESNDLSKVPLLSGQYGHQGIDPTAFGGASNLAAHGPFFDWSNDGDPGMDLDAMAFSHDFYSDTFQII